MTPITAEIDQISYRESEVAWYTFLLLCKGQVLGLFTSVSADSHSSIATDCVKS